MVCSRPIVYLFRAPYSTCSNGSSHVGSIRVHVELVNGCPILTPVCQHMELVIEIVFANRRCACQGLFALEAGHVDTVRNNGTDTKRVCRVVRPQHETVCGISFVITTGISPCLHVLIGRYAKTNVVTGFLRIPAFEKVLVIAREK